MYRCNGGGFKCSFLFLFDMKIKCDECKGIGSYDCDSEPGPYGTRINVECEDCDGEGWIEVEDDEEEWTDITVTFTGDPSRTYHITYFINRGDVVEESTPLLGGLTLTAESITHAITQFMSTSGVDESEIKYIVEL
jgi:hypothetical protein